MSEFEVVRVTGEIVAIIVMVGGVLFKVLSSLARLHGKVDKINGSIGTHLTEHEKPEGYDARLTKALIEVAYLRAKVGLPLEVEDDLPAVVTPRTRRRP